MPHYVKLLLDCPLVIAAIFICGIGGTFQYGFSISVMTSPSAFIQALVNQTCVQRYNVPLEQWQISLIWSFMVSIFCIGGLIGCLVAGSLVTRFGRRQCLLLNNVLAICGAVLMLFSKMAMSFEMIMVARLLYGLNSGVALMVQTMYLVECAPKRLKAMVGVTVGTFVSFGKFSGQLLGISELLGTEERWPWLLGFTGFTALFQLSTLSFLPESPSALLLDRGDRLACEKAMRRLWGDKDYSREVEEMLQEKAAVQGARSYSVLELIRDQSMRWQLLTLTVAFITLQLCGINAVYFYSFEVFRAAGIQEHQLRYTALGTGLCELSTSVACFMMVENTGKKVLMVRGYLGMSATLILLVISLSLQSYLSWMPYCSMVLIFVFAFFFCSGPSGVTAPLPGEMLTQSYKSAGFTVACTLNWCSLFMLGMLFPVVVETLDYFCFLIFLFFCLGCALFMRLNVPETKNRTALEIAAEFHKMHGSRKETLRRRRGEDKSNQQTANGVHKQETKL